MFLSINPVFCLCLCLCFVQDRLKHVYEELSGDEAESIPLRLLLQHPLTNDLIQRCLVYKLVDSVTLLASCGIGDSASDSQRVDGVASQLDAVTTK